jgi:hypothetical protein
MDVPGVGGSSVPEMPRIRGRWTSYTYGCWEEEGAVVGCALVERVMVVYSDDTVVDSAHDARDPMRQRILSTDDGTATETAAAVMDRCRGYVRMQAPVAEPH